MFYLARGRGEEQGTSTLVWQEHERAHLYVYVPNTGKFHRNDPMTTDFYFDQEVLTFEAIEVEQARQSVQQGIGRIDERKNKWLVQKYRQDAKAIDPAQILPKKDDEGKISLSPAQHAKHMLILVRSSAPGVWLTYRSYPESERQKALTAAYDLRKGKVKAFRDTGVQARVVGTSAGHEVQITRPRPAV